MAQGKGGKTDPTKVTEKKKEGIRLAFKMSQAKAIIRTLTRMRVSTTACVTLSNAVTYLLIEIIDGAHNSAVSDQKKKILPKHINACIATDNELNHLGAKWLIRSGGATGYLKNEDAGVKGKGK